MAAAVVQGSIRAVPEDLFYTAFCIPYFPVLYAFSLPESAKAIPKSHIRARRVFGARQLLVLAGATTIPIASVVVAAARNADSTVLILVALMGVISIVAFLVRFTLLIKQRDWSYNQEQLLRNYGEELIGVSGRAEIVGVTSKAIDGLGGSSGPSAIIKSTDSGFELVAETAFDQPFKPTKLKPTHIGPKADKAQAWFANYPDARATISTPVPQASGSTSGQQFFVAALKKGCLLYTSPSPRDATLSRMPSSA